MTALSLFDPDGYSASAITVPRVVELYLDHIRDRVASGTYDDDNFLSDEHYLRHFAAGHPLAVDVYCQKDLETWFADHPTWKSGHTKKGINRRVLACFTWAASPKKGALIERCPFEMIEAVSEIPYKARRSATYGEYLGLMRHGSLRFRQGLFFIFRTGCRPCEMRELIWPWVHLDRADPCLELEWHKTKRKTGKTKIIGLDDINVRFLRNLWRSNPRSGRQPLTTKCRCGMRFPHDPGDHVFLNCLGEPWSRRAYGSNLRACARRAGLDEGVEAKVSAGCFRTTFACDLIELGMSDREVADALGHETTDMVNHVYGAETRRRAGHLGNIANRAAKLRKGKM